MSRKALLPIVAVLVATNLYSAYRTLDTGVTVTYLEASWESQQEDKRLLGEIAVELARVRSEGEIEAVVRQAFGTRVIDREGDTLYVGDVGLRFKESRLASVVFMDDAPEDAEAPRSSFDSEP